MPPFVLRRTTKGGLDGVAHEGLRRHAPLIAELLGPTSRLADLGLLPPGGVGQEVAAAEAGRPGAGAIHYAVAAEMWLRQVAASRPTTWWSPVGEAAHRAAA